MTETHFSAVNMYDCITKCFVVDGYDNLNWKNDKTDIDRDQHVSEDPLISVPKDNFIKLLTDFGQTGLKLSFLMNR